MDLEIQFLITIENLLKTVKEISELDKAISEIELEQKEFAEFYNREVEAINERGRTNK